LTRGYITERLFSLVLVLLVLLVLLVVLVLLLAPPSIH
jgi:uncharacterized BrkB/YihY/UPF0761 family membrane protein